MSASNWGRCPKCVVIAERARKKLHDKAAESYGKVGSAEFIKLMNKAEAPIKIGDTLREDYEQGIDSDGEYSVSYRASCDKCGFEFSFKHTEQAMKED